MEQPIKLLVCTHRHRISSAWHSLAWLRHFTVQHISKQWTTTHNKKEWITDTHNNLDGSQRHCADWKKLVSKGRIPFIWHFQKDWWRIAKQQPGRGSWGRLWLQGSMRNFRGSANVFNPECGSITRAYACDNVYRAVLKKKKSQLKRRGHKHREKVRVDCAWLVCEVLYLFLRNLHGMVKYDPAELWPHLAWVTQERCPLEWKGACSTSEPPAMARCRRREKEDFSLHLWAALGLTLPAPVIWVRVFVLFTAVQSLLLCTSKSDLPSSPHGFYLVLATFEDWRWVALGSDPTNW